MKSPIIILTLLTVLVSCSDKDNDGLNQNYLTGKFIVNDTVSRQFDLWGCFCNLTEGGVKITNTSGVGFEGQNLVTLFGNGDTTFTFRTWTDVGRTPDFTIKEQLITLSKSDLRLGDSLQGKVNVKGHFIENQQNGSFEISGHFKCKLQDSTYGFQSYQRDLHEQYDSLRLMKLKRISSINPDSVLELEFRYGNFHLIENEITRFKKLEKLSLVDFPKVKGELLSNFKLLKQLTIEGDSLRIIPSSVGDLKRLERLDIRGPISVIPKSLYNLTTLKELDVSATDITEISNQIRNLKNLEILDISYTNIKNIPREIFELPKLASLSLPDTITLFKIKNLNLESLKTLDVSYELLFYNKADIDKLQHLESLNLTFIYKTHEEETAKHRERMKWLEERLPNVDIFETLFVDYY